MEKVSKNTNLHPMMVILLMIAKRDLELSSLWLVEHMIVKDLNKNLRLHLLIKRRIQLKKSRRLLFISINGKNLRKDLIKYFSRIFNGRIQSFQKHG